MRDPIDPKNLIADAFAIDGIDKTECRSIFLDWALSLQPPYRHETAIKALLERHDGEDEAGHPMRAVLAEGLEQPSRTGRRGGRRARMVG